MLQFQLHTLIRFIKPLISIDNEFSSFHADLLFLCQPMNALPALVQGATVGASLSTTLLTLIFLDVSLIVA
jgi:hypothetical protein